MRALGTDDSYSARLKQSLTVNCAAWYEIGYDRECNRMLLNLTFPFLRLANLLVLFYVAR